MSWRDRDYAGDDDPMRKLGRPGGDWQGLRPSFDNPLSWAVLIGRIAGIEIRIHIFFLLFIIIALLRTLMAPHQAAAAPVGFGIMALAIGCLFVIVLAHEFGHCLACRWAGGEANEILMWPLGGLAYTQPKPRWQAHMATTLGGPLVNVLICLLAMPFLVILTGQFLGTALPNPLTLFDEWRHHPSIAASWPAITVYFLNAMSLILLLFNLLPIFPLDGGRIVQAALWPRLGYVRSMRMAVRTGFVGAILMLIFGAVVSAYWVVGIAIFGGITCWLTHKQITFLEEMAGGGEDYAASLALGAEPEESERNRKPTREEMREAKRLEQERVEAMEIDRILDKIAASGMNSLTRREKHLLERYSEKRRHGG